MHTSTSDTLGNLTQGAAAGSTLDVCVEPLHDAGSVEREWRSLESRAAPTFFQCWEWVGALLDHAKGTLPPQVLRVTEGQALRGLALLWPHRQRRHLILSTRALHLHETGWPEFDRVTIEHNGILAQAGLERAVLKAVVERLARLPGWDECYLSGMDEPIEQAMPALATACGLAYHRRWSKTCHVIDLEAVRAGGGDYLDALSANTRYQARRALKGYGGAAALRCERASTIEDAMAWFEDLARLHQAHWTARGEPGAFSSEFTRAFHSAVIKRGWPRGVVQLVRVTAGDDLVGYVYNFEHSGVVSNYQSGHVAAPSNKLKPGLVVHCLAVQEATNRGLRCYDLLMGGDHFKPSLTNQRSTMAWGVLQRRRPLLMLENRLRTLRDRWRSGAGVSRADAAGSPELADN